MTGLLQEVIKRVGDKIILAKKNHISENQLRYDIGEILTIFYRDKKKEINNRQYDIQIEIKSFYSLHELGISSNSGKNWRTNSNWSKILIAVGDWLKIKKGYEGYGITNLNYMQQFYRKYKRYSYAYEKAMKLGWSHNIVLLKDKLSDSERSYYLEKTLLNTWTVKKLEEQIKDESYDDFIRVIENEKYNFKIDNLKIHNYKSLVNIEIRKPSKLMVFAGANATGKSNIFEAVEFLVHSAMTKREIVFEFFGGVQSVINRSANRAKEGNMKISLDLAFNNSDEKANYGIEYNIFKRRMYKDFTSVAELDDRLENSFSRIFIDNNKRAENKIRNYDKLWFDGSNLSQILKKIFEDKFKRNEIIEWIKILIPEILDIRLKKDLSGREELEIIEKSYPNQPFTGSLISEGTYNIIAIIALFYQSEHPQFLCIEEPEIGLNPAILSELVPFFRDMIERYNHQIWITTHSISLVSELKEEELVIVNKKNGQTNVYQCVEGDFEDMNPGEAWMSNMLKGGGLPW